MLTILGILFAVAPAVAWLTITRTRFGGFAIGGALLAGACLLISVQQSWIEAPRACLQRLSLGHHVAHGAAT
ncbi:hypothetical protein ABZ371_30570 [Streptomyces sp. NPDC005899]|uniref:hypothetical protein n=1 Tax=Streptomyces sp. NPDC005899 TaxID=3155716 RepID=UPI0033CCA7B7